VLLVEGCPGGGGTVSFGVGHGGVGRGGRRIILRHAFVLTLSPSLSLSLIGRVKQHPTNKSSGDF
jgi:hypothetical protein